MAEQKRFLPTVLTHIRVSDEIEEGLNGLDQWFILTNVQNYVE